MPVTSTVDLLFDASPPASLRELACRGHSDRAVVSCYLDTRAGLDHCTAFLNRKAARIRDALSGVDRLDFDCAIALIRRQLEHALAGDCQGVALFARAAMSDRQLTLAKTMAPVDNRLVYSRAPEILPLLALHQRSPHGRLLLMRDGTVELLPIGPGSSAEPTFSGPLPANMPREVTGRKDAVSAHHVRQAWRGMADPQRELREALAASRGPLLVAGPKALLVGVSEWLPGEATDRLVGCVETASDTDRRTVADDARGRLSALCRAEAKRLAIATVEDRHSGASAVGYRPVLEALQADAADTLVLSDWDQFGLGLPWESKVMVCFEALRRGCRVVLCDSLPLREAGGVGCVLRSPHAADAPRSDTATGRLQDVAA